MNPTALEFTLKRWEIRSATLLAEKLGFWGAWIPAFFLAWGVARFGNFLIHHDDLAGNGGLGVLRLIRFGILLVILLSPLTLLPARPRLRFQFLLLCLVWLISAQIYFGSVYLLLTRFLIFSFLPLMALAAWFFLRATENRKRHAWIFSGVFWLFFSAISLSLHHAALYSHVELFWSFKLPFFWLSILVFGLVRSGPPGDPAMAFCPTNALRGSLWPTTSRMALPRPLRLRLWWQGLGNIFLGYLAIAARVQLETGWIAPVREVAWLEYSSRYPLAILGIIGFLNVLTGATRMLGFDVPDATSFVWLARSPADYWRRGAVYHYQFILRFVYLPLYRKVKNTVIAAGLAFFVFFINKNGVANVLFFFADLFHFEVAIPYYDRTSASYAATLWTLWFFLLVISSRWWFFRSWAKIRPAWAWGSILMTHCMMASLYYGAHLLRLFSG